MKYFFDESALNFELFSYLHLPGVQLLGDIIELCDGVLLGGLQHAMQVTDALFHSHRHLLPLGCRLRALVKGGAEGLTDLPHAAAKLITLEEQDEDYLELTLALETGDKTVWTGRVYKA